MLSLVHAHTSIMSVTDHDDDRMGNEETKGWGWMDGCNTREVAHNNNNRSTRREREKESSHYLSVVVNN